MIDDPAARAAMERNRQNKSIELLLGLVTGVIADRQLHDLEIQFLQTWLSEHRDVAEVWPGSVIASTVRDVLADGLITAEERAHLLQTLQQMAVTDFSITGSASSEVLQLPIDDNIPVDLRDNHICLTGTFLYGTRAKCEHLALQAGAWPVSTITRKVAYLIIGTNVSPHWAHTSYGRKIEQAVQLKNDGHRIGIISERRWLDVLSSRC